MPPLPAVIMGFIVSDVTLAGEDVFGIPVFEGPKARVVPTSSEESVAEPLTVSTLHAISILAETVFGGGGTGTLVTVPGIDSGAKVGSPILLSKVVVASASTDTTVSIPNSVQKVTSLELAMEESKSPVAVVRQRIRPMSSSSESIVRDEARAKPIVSFRFFRFLFDPGSTTPKSYALRKFWLFSSTDGSATHWSASYPSSRFRRFGLDHLNGSLSSLFGCVWIRMGQLFDG